MIRAASYDENRHVYESIVPFDIGASIGVIEWKAEVSKYADEEVNGETNEVLLGQDFVHSPKSRNLELLETLQKVDLSRETENEDRKSSEASKRIHGFDAVEFSEVFADRMVERVENGQYHDVNDGEES